MQTKTIKLLLNDGSLKGLINIVDSVWFSGELYSAPRDQVDELVKSDACKRYGVYLLLSNDKVYIGQASDLSKRIQQHIIGKDWWERVIVLTTDNNSFDHSDIDYLESILIEKAKESGKIDTENKVKGVRPKVNKFRAPELEQYLNEALFLLELIGVNVFTSNKKEDTKLIETIEKTSPNAIEKRSKAEAINYLKSNGFNVSKCITYASLNEKKNLFWANPKIEFVNNDWSIILNNQIEGTITLLEIPKNTFSINGNKPLKIRKDKPYYIDLYLDAKTLIESNSKNDFSKYSIFKKKY